MNISITKFGLKNSVTDVLNAAPSSNFNQEGALKIDSRNPLVYIFDQDRKQYHRPAQSLIKSIINIFKIWALEASQ